MTTDYVFGDPNKLRYSLVLMHAVLGPLAVLVFWKGLRAYGEAYARAREPRRPEVRTWPAHRRFSRPDVPRPVRAGARRDRPRRLRSRRQTARRSQRHVLPRRPGLPVPAALAQHPASMAKATSACFASRTATSTTRAASCARSATRRRPRRANHCSAPIAIRAPTMRACKGVSRGTANTTPMFHHGKLFALKEDSPPVALDPDTLETHRRLLHLRRQAEEPHLHRASEDRFRNRRDDRLRLRGAAAKAAPTLRCSPSIATAGSPMRPGSRCPTPE